MPTLCPRMLHGQRTPVPGGAQAGQPCTPTHSGSSVGASTQLGSWGAGIQEGELELKASHFWILVPVSAPGCFHGNWRRTWENKVRVCSGGPLAACLALRPSGPAASPGHMPGYPPRLHPQDAQLWGLSRTGTPWHLPAPSVLPPGDPWEPGPHWVIWELGPPCCSLARR